jgi:hypothetical protein
VTGPSARTHNAGSGAISVVVTALLCAGTFVVGAKLGEAVPSDLSVV